MQVRHPAGLWHTYMVDDEWTSPSPVGLDQYVIAPSEDADIFVALETCPRFQQECAPPPGGPPPAARALPAAGGAGGPPGGVPPDTFTFVPPTGSALANPPTLPSHGGSSGATARLPPFFDSRWDVLERDSEMLGVVLNGGQRVDDLRGLQALANAASTMQYAAAGAGEPVTIIAVPAFSARGKGRFRVTVYSSAPLLLLRDHDHARSSGVGAFGAGGGFAPIPMFGGPGFGSFSTFGAPPPGRAPPFSATADRGRRAFRVLAPTLQTGPLQMQIGIPGLGGVGFGFKLPTLGFGFGKR